MQLSDWVQNLKDCTDNVIFKDEKKEEHKDREDIHRYESQSEIYIKYKQTYNSYAFRISVHHISMTEQSWQFCLLGTDDKNLSETVSYHLTVPSDQ